MGSEQSTESSAHQSFTSEGLQYTSSSNDDFRDLRPRYLDKFIAEQLQIDENFRKVVYTALDRLCRCLQNKMRPNVKRLIKGGSMGKGTALKGRSDLDCILVMNGVKDAPDLREKIEGILAQLRRILEEDPLTDFGWNIRIIRVDRYLVNIEMLHCEWNESVEVDILPTFDASVFDEYSRCQLYECMKNYRNYAKQLCSAALAELQLEFIRPKPAKVKNLIRLVKHWCKTYLPHERGMLRVPNSYMVELLTIHVWEKAGSPDKFDTALLFKDVMEALYNHRHLNIKWNKYYRTTMIQYQEPYIMDPANPYGNVYGIVQDWPRVQEMARVTLAMPLLRNYRSSVLVDEARLLESSSEPANYCIIS